MQINLKELSTQAIESTTTTKKMRLSENAQSMVFQLFTKNVYSNPIGTVVREIASNCFDSHVEANVNAPILIKKFLDNATNTTYISFIDYGVGMSPDRIENIYGVYFESTKRIDNTQIGGFGIGGKTPLAYKRSTGQGEGEYDNSFYVITNFNGTRYYYCIYEGADTPVITLLHQEETTERNGTEIRIPVLEKDVDTFAKEMVRQLYYFENIIIEGFEGAWKYGDILTNDYQIIKGKTFLFRGKDYSENVHICLGRVAYPIDYAILGLNSSDYRLPIALKLNVGDINVTVSRESIDYSESTIKMLKAKLLEVKAEIISQLMKQYENIVTLEQYFNVKNEFGTLFFGNGKSMYVGNLIKQSDIDFSNFAYSLLKMPNDKQLFKLFFDVKTYGKKPARSRYSNKYEFQGGYAELRDNTNILHVNDTFNRKVLKQAYLKDKYEMYHIINKRDLRKNVFKSEIFELFNVQILNIVEATGKPDAFIQTLLDMQEEYFTIVQDNSEDYDTLEVPEEFIEGRKKQRNVITADMRKLTIPAKIFGSYGKDRIQLDALFNYNSPIFYGTHEDETSLKNAHLLFGLLFKDNISVYQYSDYAKQFITRNGNKKQSIMFIMVSQANAKYMNFCKKAIHVDNFYWKMLHRKENAVKEYFQTHKIIDNYNDLSHEYKDENFVKIDTTWGYKIIELKKLIDAIPTSSSDYKIGNEKKILSTFFNLDNIKMSKEHEEIDAKISEIKLLERNNSSILRYINMPYRLEYLDVELCNILKKVMAL